MEFQRWLRFATEFEMITNELFETLVIEAIKHDRAEHVSRLLGRYGNSKDYFLQMAVQCNEDLLIFKLLLESGADIYVRDGDWKSLMHLAVRNRNKEFLGLLIEFFESTNRISMLNVEDKHGNTPIGEAILSNQPHNYFTLLEDSSVDVSLTNNDKQSILHLLVTKFDKHEIFAVLNETFGNKRVAHRREEVLGLVNSTDRDKNTPMILSIKHQDSTNAEKIVKFLFKFGADTEMKNTFGQTALHLAAFSRDRNVVRFLLTKGADVNVEDNKGKTPLIYAVEKDDLSLLTLLLDYTSLGKIRSSRIYSDNCIVFTKYHATFIKLLALKQESYYFATEISDNVAYSRYLYNCKLELEQTKHLRVLDKSISFYDLLTKNKFILRLNILNEIENKCITPEKLYEEYRKFLKALETDESYKITCPLYKTIIKQKIEELKFVGSILIDIGDLFSRLTKKSINHLPSLPVDCCVIIFEHLSSADNRNFRKSLI